MTKPITLSAQIPFSGFYETAHSDAIDRAIKDCFYNEETGEDLPIPHDFYFSFKHYLTINNEYSRLYVSEWIDYFNDATGLDIKPVTFEEMTSPKEYNFETDRLFATLTLKAIKQIRAYVDDDTLAETIRERCTSYDGFISFYSNDFATWNSKPLSKWDHNELGILLQAALTQAGIENARRGGDAWDIMENAMCNGKVDAIVYPYVDQWKQENPDQDTRAATFFDIPDTTWENFTKEERLEHIERYNVATYRCPLTQDMFTLLTQ
jgi:hypothetical protein